MKRVNLLAVIFGLMLLTALVAYGVSNLGQFRDTRSAFYPDGIFAEIHTNKGIIALKLEYEKTPMTVANFVGLAEGTIKNAALPEGTPYFDGSVFQRVVPGHVIQGGSPVSTESRGPGYTFPNEIHPGLSHDKAGMLGMARGAPHTNASQFYITLGDRSYLDGDYTVFGSVIDSMDVVNSIVRNDTMYSIRIIRVGEKAQAFRADTDTFNKLVESAKIRIKDQEEMKKRKEAELIETNWPDAITTDSGLRYIILKEGAGTKPAGGAKLSVKYTGSVLDGKKFCSSENEGRPVSGESAIEFEFKAGESSVNNGFNEALLDMKKGEKRLVIVPAALAYGTSGFYGRERQGEKRFVISANKILVYEIELHDIK